MNYLTLLMYFFEEYKSPYANLLNVETLFYNIRLSIYFFNCKTD